MYGSMPSPRPCIDLYMYGCMSLCGVCLMGVLPNGPHSLHVSLHVPSLPCGCAGEGLPMAGDGPSCHLLLS